MSILGILTIVPVWIDAISQKMGDLMFWPTGKAALPFYVPLL
jgi:hypothetical protein